MSDLHAAYDRIPAFLHSASAVRKRFLERYPEGKVILVINGDFADSSEWGIHDRGQLELEVIKKLATGYELVAVLGNHGGFDHLPNGHQRFLAQLQDFGIKMTAANLEPTELGAPYFQPYQDIETSDGYTLRFIGLTLRRFFNKSSYDPKDPLQILRDVDKLLPAAQAQLESLKGKKHTRPILVAHTRIENLEKLVGSLDGSPEPLFAVAGHDHRYAVRWVRNIPIFDSRTEYDFHAIELDSEGHLASLLFFDHKLQESIRRSNFPLLDLEAEILASIRPTLEDLIRTNSRPVAEGEIGAIPYFREHMKRGANPLGVALAEALLAFASDVEIEGEKKEGEIPSVAFYYSSAVRRNRPIPAGPITLGTILSIYPYGRPPSIRWVTGEELEILWRSHSSFRLKKDNAYCPHLSVNLKVESEELFVKLGDAWILAREIPWVKLVLDGWLTTNNIGLPEWEKIFKRRPALEFRPFQTQIDVNQRYLPACLKAIAPPQRE